MAELEVSRNKVQLVSFGFAPTPQNALNGGEINNPGAISQAIQALIFDLKSKRKSVATGMWGTAVIVKKITIPKMEKKLIADQIRFEAEQYIPFDINDIALAYHVVPANSVSETMDILLIAAQNELVGQYMAAVQGSGLDLAVLDVSGFALANIFEMNYGRPTAETVALLNIGAGVTNFVVLLDGEVIFSRDIPVGGFNYTNEIHKELGVTLPEAESLKLGAVAKSPVPDEVHSVLSSMNEQMTEEIRNSFEFFSGSNSGMTINRSFLTGGSSVIPGLKDQVSQACGIPAEYLNPFLRVRANPKNFNDNYLQQIAPFASVALGLGLRKVGDG